MWRRDCSSARGVFSAVLSVFHILARVGSATSPVALWGEWTGEPRHLWAEGHYSLTYFSAPSLEGYKEAVTVSPLELLSHKGELRRGSSEGPCLGQAGGAPRSEVLLLVAH